LIYRLFMISFELMNTDNNFGTYPSRAVKVIKRHDYVEIQVDEKDIHPLYPVTDPKRIKEAIEGWKDLTPVHLKKV